MKNSGNYGVQTLPECGSSIVKIIKNKFFSLMNAFIRSLPSFHITLSSKLRNKVVKYCLFLQGYCKALKYYNHPDSITYDKYKFLVQNHSLLRTVCLFRSFLKEFVLIPSKSLVSFFSFVLV